LQVIIPISLYVTLEVTKIIQLRLMQQDIKMYDENQNKRLECRALNIPEELGQVSDFTKFYSHNLFRIFREIDCFSLQCFHEIFFKCVFSIKVNEMLH